LTVLCLLLTCYALAPLHVHAGVEMRFRLLRERLIVVPIFVNGEGPFDFMLDTATSMTLVAPELAERLGLRSSESISLVTVAGSRVTPRTILRELALGEKTLANVGALVTPLERIRARDSRVHGVLGQNFLLQFNYTLDYGNRRIVFDGAGVATRRGARVPFEWSDSRLIVSVRTSASDLGSLRLVLDAAATEFILFERPPVKFTLDLSPLGDRMALTEAGSRAVRTAKMRFLQIGDERLNDLPVVLLSAPALGKGHDEDGLLPTRLFRAVYFNHSEGYVVFNPRRSG
jgi:predicted aspartyl protease